MLPVLFNEARHFPFGFPALDFFGNQGGCHGRAPLPELQETYDGDDRPRPRRTRPDGKYESSDRRLLSGTLANLCYSERFRRIGQRRSFGSVSSPNQRGKFSLSRMAGTRSWIVATRSLAGTVMIANVRTHCRFAGSFQFSQMRRRRIVRRPAVKLRAVCRRRLSGKSCSWERRSAACGRRR